MPLTKCNDIQLYYELRGQWPPQETPLLCIPGLGNDCTRWERVLPQLAARIPLLVVDNRGAGRSDAPKNDYSVAQMADDLVVLLDTLDLERVHVLGHSMGGFIAQELAARRPERVAEAILASTISRMSQRDHQLLRHWLQGVQAGVDPEWLTRDIFLWMYPPSCYEVPGFMEQVVREAMEAPHVQPLHGFAGQVAACVEFDGREGLAGIQADTLVLHGDLDMLVPLEMARAMAQTIPRGELQVLQGAGHLPHQQQPEVFVAAVLGFLHASYD